MSVSRSHQESIFDRHPTGGFDIRLRGYDQRQVEQHVRALEAAISDLRRQNEELDKRIAELRQQLMSPN
jgi:cell division septum initiation protein DivIVA